jgi:hypothetical protein
MALAETLVSIDTYVQWLRRCAAGTVTGVNERLMQIGANAESHVHRDSSDTSEGLSEFR